MLGVLPGIGMGKAWAAAGGEQGCRLMEEVGPPTVTPSVKAQFGFLDSSVGL